MITKKFFYFWFKSKVIEKLFLYIVEYSYLLLPLGFILFVNKSKGFAPILLCIYGILCFLFLHFYFEIPREQRSYYKTAYTFFEYAVFTALIFLNITNIIIKRIIVIISIGFLAFQIFYVVSGQVKRIDSIPIGIETILLLFYILFFFYQYAKNVGSPFIYNHYAFWVSVGILIYLGGSFFFFMLIDHLNSNEIAIFGNMTYIAEIVKNILFCTALFTYAKNPFKLKAQPRQSVPFLDHI